MSYCSTCKVSCPSDYQMREHLSGRKHAQKVQWSKSFMKQGHMMSSKPPPGFCFIFWQHGSCYKGSECTYKHYVPEIMTDNTESTNMSATSNDKMTSISSRSAGESNLISPLIIKGTKRLHDNSSIGESEKSALSPHQNDDISTVILLCKTVGGTADNNINVSDTTQRPKLAPIFCQPIKQSGEKKEKQRFPDEFRNLFQRKRDVNLYVENDLVVWQFAYNVQVMRAIKEHIKGRAWNPNIGRKGCWTCPLQSLPDAIALYEHMGRKPSPELTKRAKEIQDAFGSSSSDSIKLSINLSCQSTVNHDGGSDELSLGSITASFLYDVDVVAALKMLPPTQRSYDPLKKEWKIDLFALPSMLEHLEPLGYKAEKRLEDISDMVKEIESLIFDEEEKNDDVVNYEKEISANLNQSLVKVEESSDDKKIVMIEPDISCKSVSKETKDRNALLENKLHGLVSNVSQCDSSLKSLNSSNCGSAKRIRLTLAQAMWRSTQYPESETDNHTYSPNSNGYENTFATFLSNRISHFSLSSDSLVDCDCGHPEKRQRGKHTCRYFGYFDCFCGNKWTSAYCWRGEKQACRSCENESFPIRKDKLDGRKARDLNGAHDSFRCGMCLKLGRNCSDSSFPY